MKQFIIYRDRKKEFRWKLVASNGKKIAVSGEGFKRRRTVHRSIVNLADSVLAKVVDTTLKK